MTLARRATEFEGLIGSQAGIQTRPPGSPNPGRPRAANPASLKFLFFRIEKQTDRLEVREAFEL